MEKNYYVYIYLDIRKLGNYMVLGVNLKYQPFYIGKGKGKRCYTHLREAFNWSKTGPNLLKINKIRKIKKETGKNPKIYKIKNLSNCEALSLEVKLISQFGRINNSDGFLTNLTEGGESGKPMAGKKHSKETREKMSKSKIGKKFSNEHKKNIKKAALSKKRNDKLRKHYENISDEERQNRSKARSKFIKNIKSDKIKYKKWCNKISESLTGKKLSEKHKEKLRKYKTDEEKEIAKKRNYKEKARRARERRQRRKYEND